MVFLFGKWVMSVIHLGEIDIGERGRMSGGAGYLGGCLLFLRTLFAFSVVKGIGEGLKGVDA